MMHGIPTRRFCTEFDNISAYRIHDVLVVRAPNSTALFTCEFLNMLWSSL